MSQASAKKASSSLRRAASPPACSSSRKQHISGSGRNQTILNDAAWMSERIHSLQKTGFLRYPSICKLRDPGEISPSLHSLSASNKDDEETSCSSPGCFNQSSTSRRSQTVMNQTDEPLSAFRLSEVTLSEEDLLTDISPSREFSTCNSTPVLMQSSRNFDQVESEFYQGTPLSKNVGKDYQKYMQASNESPNGNANHPHSAASSEFTSSNMQGDLLLRLEALQHRAELAAKGGNSNSNASQDNQNSKLFWSRQGLHWDQDIPSSIKKQSAFTQQSNVASSASPTHSSLSIESVSWPEEPEIPLDSTCWLKAINEAKAEPSASHLILSSSRSIRPEYYLPLSREEDPVFEAGCNLFSSPKAGKRTELRNDNIRRLALGTCQRRSEQVGPGKSINSHKQTSLARKSKRFLESSMDSVNGYGSVKARGKAASLSPKTSPGVARRALPTETRPSQNHLCVEYKGIAHPVHEQSKSINQSFEMKASASEMDGQKRNSVENRFEYDGESSWISEENVEGFLCSRSFTLDEADGLSTSNEWSSPVLDTNLSHCAAKTSSFSTERHSRNKSIKESQMKDFGKGLFSSSHTQSACLNGEAVKHSNESMAGICMFDRCKEMPLPSQGGSTVTSQTDTHLQLLKEGSLADSYQPANISHHPVCQITHSADESLNNNSIACCKDTLNNEGSLKESQHDAGAKEHISRKGDSSSWSAISPKTLNRGIEESVGNNITLQVEKKLESTYIGQCHSARYSLHSSIPLVSESGPLSLNALSSPADLVEDRYWPGVADRYENATHISKMHSQNLLQRRSSELKVFARIVRSLSFSEQGNSGLKSSSKLQTSRDISESKSTGFTHYWIPNTAYSVNSSDLGYNGGKSNPQNSVEIQQTTAQITKELLQEIPSQNGRGDTNRNPEGNEASLILLDNAYLNIEQLAEEPHGMGHTVLLSYSTKGESDAPLDNDCKAPLSSENFSQQGHDLQLDRPIETQCEVQDDSSIKKVQEDINSAQQAICRGPTGGKLELDDKGCHQQSLESFTTVESLCTKTLQVEPEETRPELIFEKLALSEQHTGIPSFANQNNRLMIEGVNKGEMILKFPCTSGPENGRKCETPCGNGETPSSLLSIYKNPLWRDEVNVDFENGHGSQSQEFLDHSYSDEGNFLDSDKKRISFSKRSLGEVWDTYEGMGGFIISSVPNSPSCTTKQASEANHIPVGFDILINSSESNGFVLDSVWDVEGSAKKLRKIGEEVNEDLGFFTQQRLSCYNQADLRQQSAQSLDTIELQTTNHGASSLTPVNVKDIERNLTIESGILSDGASVPDGLDDCSREHSIGPHGSCSHSTRIINSNVTNQDAALLENESTINEFCLNSEPKCNTGEKKMPLTEMACIIDAAKAGRDALDKVDRNGSKIRSELTVQNSGASINIETISASQCADRKLQSDPLCEQYNKECTQPLRHKHFAKADAPEENHSTKDTVMLSNDATEADEEVKQVTFIYSDSKEPQKDLKAVEASLPEVPLDLLSTWILSFFTHASKGGGNFKRKEQKQRLIQDKKREDQEELKRIGKKVQALEEEIDRFKQENRRLQSLVKCMIRKMKQLQQGLRGRKRNGSSRGFMTCIYSVRVKRSSKSKIVRKS